MSNELSCDCKKYPSKIIYLDKHGKCKACGGILLNVNYGIEMAVTVNDLTISKKTETITKDEIIDLLKQFEGLKKKLHNLLKKL